ncbi:MAG: DUF368 domain-containing protein [Crocinitomicaceae bacterium]|nr:DUF368 domain-containing protein [Crocinitomicaceae bacterium]
MKSILLFLKGIAMGAADVVPGVSGGTIAFITGIYEELLETLSGLNFGLLKTWRKEGFKAFWTALNGNFLVVLFAGIFVSILSLAKLIEYLLEYHPIQLWAFFFGLIIASVWLVGKTVEKWNITTIIGLIGGGITAFLITLSTPAEGESASLIYIFLCGMIAICAMILPGISGSFILILLGAYKIILGSISDLMSALKAGDWDLVMSNGIVIAVFIVGCVAGLISFSKLLNWLFKKAKNLIIAILTGFLIGSLNKIWPWKQTLQFFIKHEGEPNEEIVPTVQENILPKTFENLNGEESFLWQALIFMVIGLTLVVSLELIGKRSAK